MGRHGIEREAMKNLIISLVILLSSVTAVSAQSLLKEDFTDELCFCLVYHANNKLQLGAITDREELITYAMDTCYGVHFLQTRTYCHTVDEAVDMMHEEEVENAYEDLAEAAVDFVIKESNK